MMRLGVMVMTMAAVLCASAFPTIPKASAKALGVTRGKKFESGLVFINGKYLPPPYQVERWGTGIRINGRPVTGQVIDWNEFLKTQAGVKVTRTVSAPVAAPVAEEKSEEETSLDDLFDDTPHPKAKKGAKKSAARKAPAVSVSYSFEGEFQPNAETKALVARINAARTEIDKTLRIGGFICFGENYSRVTGDAGTALTLLRKLPEAQREAASAEALAASLRAAGLVFFPEALFADLYRNRTDYRALMDRRETWQSEGSLNRLLNADR